jgi:hypothetical protein
MVCRRPIAALFPPDRLTVQIGHNRARGARRPIGRLIHTVDADPEQPLTQETASP